MASVSGLDRQSFAQHWCVESESPHYEVSFSGDTCEIVSPKGLTLWRKEKMKGDVVIEYDACVMDEGRETDRLSDLNCFWMASDPKHPDDILARAEWRNGVFLKCYSLQLYYLGYGGNYNKTTRFRRYDGNEDGIGQADKRPAVLREYTDEGHLLRPNHWYHVKIVGRGSRVQYYMDGELLVDYRDEKPLKEGWFGFRTTWSRIRLTNFQYRQGEETLRPQIGWMGSVPKWVSNQTFGVPFAKGKMKDTDKLSLFADGYGSIDADIWPMARWQDGSVKWAAVSAVVPAKTLSLTLRQEKKRRGKKAMDVCEDERQIVVATGRLTAYVPKTGDRLVDSLLMDGRKVCSYVDMAVTLQNGMDEEVVHRQRLKPHIVKACVETVGGVRTVVRVEGDMADKAGQCLFPFTLRMYFYQGSDEVKISHTFIYNGNQEKDFIQGMGLQFHIPFHEPVYNRHIAFSTGEGGVWSEPVQPLTGRVSLHDVYQRQMEGKPVAIADDDRQAIQLQADWAAWDGFRLSQLTDNAFSIRKRATAHSPWIGTFTGRRADGYVFLGDTQAGLGVWLKDFWQTYPSSLEVSHAREREGTLTVWLWSPEAEPMDLRHYDDRAHGLKASYEDVQEGMSTAFGIAHTSIVYLRPGAYAGKADIAQASARYVDGAQLVASPEYLHAQKAFGVWSLPDKSNAQRERVENRLDSIIGYYREAVDQYRWYGFWNYGDVMHAYDHERHQWRYDIGGYAWDNTELASPEWLWYMFLRTGRKDIWRMAEAMTRHCSETDVYHVGELAGLGSRHNVSHWGDGAKEARISQAAFNRFYYYLTADERTGDLMREVKDVDQKLYQIDPMRLAEPRSQYPCHAPARLRIGPDWMAYAGNWMTEWERTGDKRYRDKILAGMESMANLKNGLFTGNKALGYDPATGRISYDGDDDKVNTNHLMTIMGGFELMNELMLMVDMPAFEKVWLDHAHRYREMARKVSKNKFPVRRLAAYAAYRLGDGQLAADTWRELWERIEHNKVPRYVLRHITVPDVPSPVDEYEGMTTNDAALWSLDAIYMQEVIPVP